MRWAVMGEAGVKGTSIQAVMGKGSKLARCVDAIRFDLFLKPIVVIQLINDFCTTSWAAT